jgi:peptidoglycan/LPS O-acetylase OafA/YrhL
MMVRGTLQVEVAIKSSMKHFRLDIQGLRAVAILLVVCFHAGVPGISGGFVGVDVFFVVSGYLITSMLVSEIETTRHISLVNFYAKRARRLLPASLLMTCVVLIACRFIYSPEEIIEFANTAFYSIFFSSNFWFINKASDYFAASSSANPFLHTWTLGVEEQFYLVWPIFLSFSLFFARSSKSIVVVLASITLTSFAICLNLTFSDRPWAFYSCPARAWEFGLGGLASLLPHPRSSWESLLLPAAGWLGLTAVLASSIYLNEEMQFPGAIALVPVIGTVLLLIAGTTAGKWAPSVLLNTLPMQEMGKLSYSWYLWHWPVLVLAAVKNPDLTIGGRLLWVTIALLIATAAYYLVEAPVRRSVFLRLRPIVSLGLAVALVAGVATIGLGVRRIALKQNKAPELAAIREAMSHETDYAVEQCLYQEHATPCIYGKQNSPITIVLFGDSHAWQWFAPIEEISLNQGWRLVTYMKGSCPTAQIPAETDPDCFQWRQQAVKQILDLKPSLVITSDSANYGIGNQDDWERGHRETLQAISSANIRTLLILETPQLYKFDVPLCLSRAAAFHRASASACGMRREDVYALKMHSVERSAAAGLPFVTLLDLTKYFCEADFCPAIINNTIVYLDNNHISVDYARALTPVLLPYLISMVTGEQVPSEFSQGDSGAQRPPDFGNVRLK